MQKDLRKRRGQLWAVGSESRAQIRSRERRGMASREPSDHTWTPQIKSLKRAGMGSLTCGPGGRSARLASRPHAGERGERLTGGPWVSGDPCAVGSNRTAEVKSLGAIAGDGDPAGDLAGVGDARDPGAQGPRQDAGKVRGGMAGRMRDSPGLAVVEETPATSGGGWEARSSPAKTELAIWGSIGVGVSFGACQSLLEWIRGLTGANAAVGRARDGDRRQQRAAHGQRAPRASGGPSGGTESFKRAQG